MPGVYRYGINQLEKMLEPLIAKGLQSVLLFGVSKHLEKVTFIMHHNIEILVTFIIKKANFNNMIEKFYLILINFRF